MTRLKAHNYQSRITVIAVSIVSCLSGCGESDKLPAPTTQAPPAEAAVVTKQIGTAGSLTDMRDKNALMAEVERQVRKSTGGRTPTANDYAKYGAFLKHTNDFESAVIAAGLALKLDPNCAEAYLVRGAAMYYSTENLSEEQMKDLQKASKLMPTNAEAHRLLGNMYAARKEYKRSVDEFTIAIKLSQGDRDLFRHRAAAYSAIGQKEQALNDLDMFIKQKVNSPIGYHLKAGIFEGMHRDKDAIACYDNAIKYANSRDLDGILGLRKERGRLLAKYGNYKEAQQDFCSVLETDPDDEDAYSMRGDTYSMMGKYEDAIGDFTKAIEKSPSGYRRLNFEKRSRAYSKLGKLDLANADLEKAKQERERPAEEKIYELK